MDTALVIKIALSFVVGGFAVALQTLLAERYTSWRGVILAMPSTLVFGILFIGLTKESADVVEATRVIPLTEVAVYAYVLVFALLIKRGLVTALIGAVTVWGVLAYGLLQFNHPPILVSALFALVGIAGLYVVARKFASSDALVSYPLTIYQLGFRSVLAGAVISGAVLLSVLAGNAIGGMFTAFPAVFTSTFIIYYKLQDPKVLPGVAHSLFFPGAIGLMLYPVVINISVQQIGIWWSTMLAYAVFGAFVLVWSFMSKRLLD